MAINFPNSPTLGQSFTTNGITYTWNGVAWRTASGVQGVQGTQGIQGIQGVQSVQGTTGIQGSNGLQGLQGLQGIASTGSVATLSDAILALNPTAYWRCNESINANTLIDSSGNGYDLTPNTALQPYLGNYPLVPSDPLTKHALFNNGANNNATRADSCGIAVPITGDWSFHAVINPRIISGTDQTIFAIGGLGETEALNSQISVSIAGSSGNLQAIWEYGAGSNETMDSDITLNDGVTYQIVVAKDGANNAIRFYVNGAYVSFLNYTNEPTGGSSLLTMIGATILAPIHIGEVALFDGVQLRDEVMPLYQSFLYGGYGAGIQGVQGLDGLYAAQGIQGTTGAGTQGVQGLDGAYAAQGIQGLQGVQGTTGPQGIQGVQGVQGTQGLQGVQGLIGSQSGCIVTRAATQTLATAGVEYSVSFDTQVQDDENYWDAGTPTRITIPTDGWYTIVGTVIAAATGCDIYALRLSVDGAARANTDHQTRHGSGSTSITSYVQVTDYNYYTAGQYFELKATCRSGTNNTIYARLTILRDAGLGLTGIQGWTGTQGTQGIQGLDGLYAAQGIQGLQGIQGVSPSISGAYVTANANQSLTGAVSNSVIFNTEVIDTDGYWNPANPSRFTIPTTGFYTISAHVRFVGTETGGPSFYLNSTANTAVGSNVLAASLMTTSYEDTLAWVGYLQANDFVDIGCYVSNAATIDNVNYPARATIARHGTGPMGIQGATGIQGLQGLQGIQGLDGLYAAQGIQGVQGAAGTAGRHSIWISAAAMIPSSNGGCAPLAVIPSSANMPDISTLNFDATTAEYAQFSLRLPKSWNEGNVTFAPVWSHPTTVTNFGVAWGLAGVAVSNGDGIAANNYGDAVLSIDTGGTANTIYIGPESGNVTINGAPTAEDLLYFRMSRAPGDGGDTLAVDARLHGITIYIITDAETDA